MNEASYTEKTETTVVKCDAFEIRLITTTHFDGRRQFTWTATINTAYSFLNLDGVEDIVKSGWAQSIEGARKDAYRSIKNSCYNLRKVIDCIESDLEELESRVY